MKMRKWHIEQIRTLGYTGQRENIPVEVAIISPIDETEAIVAEVNLFGHIKNGMKYARLIASAPEMYDLLIRIEKLSGEYGIPYVIEIRDLLDKIE